jgi:hypothetical protein
MRFRFACCLLAAALLAQGQTVCPATPAYSPCDIVFELSSAEMAAHPHPYSTLELSAEFRSPHFRTYRMPAFWDGGNRMLIRFTPTEAGDWNFQVSSNLERFDAKQGQFQATASDSHGFLAPANVHHWALVDDNVRTPHLWMGDTLNSFPYMDRAQFEQIAAARAAQKFNHLRGVLLPKPGQPQPAFSSAGEPVPAVFQEIDSRVRYLNAKGIVADLVLAWDAQQVRRLFPSWKERERFVRYIVARYAAMHVTWQILGQFENAADSRALLKEMGLTLKKLDPFRHPRSTGTLSTSAPFLGDEWMNYVADGVANDDLGAIQHQLYAASFVNFGLDGASPGTLRHQLWNASMDGQYPSAAALPPDPDSPAARQMTAWFDFFSRTRHWELEPYFDVDGGRALALERPDDDELEGIEYVVYIEKPGPVEVLVQRRGYDVAWFNPVTGDYQKQKKGFKGDRFTGTPPDLTHDWVLHIFREGRLESMARSYKFESRTIVMQEIETAPQRVPFEVAEPLADTISVSKPPNFAVKVTRETRATRSMMFLWTGEVASDQQGARVIATGAKGTFRIPSNIALTDPATLTVRLYGMNAMGKVYTLIKVYQLVK